MRTALVLMLLRRAASLAVRTALRDAVKTLQRAAVPEPEASAEWLMAHVLKATDRTSVQRAIATKQDLDATAQAEFEAYIDRRLTREPVQYIVGAWAFHDIELELAPPTLIPRPETEELVDLVLDWWGPSNKAVFADVGCGSGCLGLALLNKLPPGSTCRAVDISEEAVALATRNAQRLGLAGAYDASLTAASDLRGAFDFIVSNPPYIPSRDLATLDAEVARFEDPRALDGGADGLDVARVILDGAPAALRGARQAVWLELDPTGPGLLENPYPGVAAFEDMTGKARFVRVDF